MNASKPNSVRRQVAALMSELKAAMRQATEEAARRLGIRRRTLARTLEKQRVK